MTTETLTTASVSPWTCPSGVTVVQVEMWGGGGRGGTRTTNGAGGGGGGGAYSRLDAYAVTPASTYAFDVGAGSTTTTAGEDTFWVTTAVGLAKGGASCNNNTITGAAGGVASSGVGDARGPGGDGATGTIGSFGGGGGSGGDGFANGSGATGGDASGQGGTGGNGRSGTQGVGLPGAIPGGGGGGGLRISSGTSTGGAGAAGQIILTYTAGPEAVLPPVVMAPHVPAGWPRG